MSVPRACTPCRLARSKCDRIRPACGRCSLRAIRCHGFPSDTDLVFRDENATAQRNSVRARNTRKTSKVLIETFHLNPATRYPFEVDTLQEHRLAVSLSEPLKRDAASRAVDRFLVDWANHPIPPGASSALNTIIPALYLSASPNSALGASLHALACAEMQEVRYGNVSFRTQARLSYGRAITHLRTAIMDDTQRGTPATLHAILFMETFEVIYLAKNIPLGPHKNAVKYILDSKAQNIGQKTDFALWRASIHRLQARQLLELEPPDANQIAWIKTLNTKIPDLHISVDTMNITVLASQVQSLIAFYNKLSPQATISPNLLLTQATALCNNLRSLITDIQTWTSEVGSPLDPPPPPPPQASSTFTFSSSPRSNIIDANPTSRSPYMFAFQAASHIILHKAFLDILSFIERISAPSSPSSPQFISTPSTSHPPTAKDLVQEHYTLAQHSRHEIARIASHCIDIVPLLLGQKRSRNRPDPSSPGKRVVLPRREATILLETEETVTSSTHEHWGEERSVLRISGSEKQSRTIRFEHYRPEQEPPLERSHRGQDLAQPQPRTDLISSILSDKREERDAGLVVGLEADEPLSPQRRLGGRFFALFVMSVLVRTGEYVPEEQRATAKAVVERLNGAWSLG